MTITLDSVQSQFQRLPEDVCSKLQDWFKWDKNEKTRKELFDLIKEENFVRLNEMMLQRQVFGTAGIRAIMESGFNGLNDLVIIQTSQGLAKYLKSLYTTGVQSIVIGFDGRYGSKRFAQLTANIFHHIGWKVYLYSRVTPTPLVAFGVRMTGSVAGIMITASHNPKIYNGYKVYFSNGAQIVSPHDQHIQENILKNLEPFNDDIWNTDKLSYNGDNLIDPIDQAMNEYFGLIKKNATRGLIVSQSDLRVTYTPLHGVGHECLKAVFSTLGFKNAFPVLSQKDPDPEFSTVVFPNPEEGQGVLNESMMTAKLNNASLIFANDPDSDRFAAAELQNDGQWRVFNGNELGALLGWWCLHEMTGSQRENCYMLSSAVSSKILETIAKHEGIHWKETLTGFKWMGNLADELEKKGKNVLFSFEEAIGFMIGTQVLDKDGISATAVAIQMAAYLHQQNLNLAKQLDRIYELYGYHYSINSYFICYDKDKISRIFNRVVDLDGPSCYIKFIDGVKVVRIRDLNRGFDSSTNNKKPVLPTSSSSFMLTLYLENGSNITFRTSGTEPKIKYYSEIVATSDALNWSKVRESHRRIVEAAVEIVLQPEVNHLQSKKD